MLLLVGNIVNWWLNRGLITLEADPMPLSEVIRTFERQGGITLKTSIDSSTPVTLSLYRVPVMEALDTLSVRLDARLQVAYVFGPSRSEIQSFLGQWTSGKPPEDWERYSRPTPPLMAPGTEDIVFDPRRDIVRISVSTPSELQKVLEASSQKVEAALYTPKSWNPAVTSLPSITAASKYFPKLASKVGGETEEVFLLSIRDRGNGGGGGDRPRFGGGGGFPRMDPAAMEERLLDRIEQLPEEKQPEAKKWLAEQKERFSQMAGLTPEQRREKFRELMDNPAAQEQMEERQAARDAKRSPAQRRDRAKAYVDRKAGASR
jgi:hypothetical protein